MQKLPNSIANASNSIAKVVNSIAKTCSKVINIITYTILGHLATKCNA